MQLENSFSVPLPVDEAWRVLLDIERIAPCMPGAALDSVGGEIFTGSIKVKLGPINLTYQGRGSVTQKDDAAHRAVIEARGKDQRGNGTAASVMTVTLTPDGPGTRVDVVTDLTLTGRPAQFGRGVMTDVGDKLLGQFSDKLAAQLDAEPAVTGSSPGPVTKAAATASGAVGEIAASVEQVPGKGPAATAVKKAAAATKKAAANATEKVSEPVPAAKTAPAKKSAPARKAAPAKKAAPAAKAASPSTKAASPSTRAAKKAEPAAATDVAPTSTGARRPSGPPTGPSAPPARPATGAPARSVPSAGPRSVPPVAPAAPARTEPIDLLEVSGASSGYAPLVGAAAAVVAVVLLVRRRRRRRSR